MSGRNNFNKFNVSYNRGLNYNQQNHFNNISPKPKNQFKKVLIVGINLFSVLLLTVSGVISYSLFNNQGDISSNVMGESEVNKTKEKASAVSSSIEVPQPEKIEMNTLFFGDVFFGRRINNWSQTSELKEAYPFSGLNTFEREKYDAWIANLECPITDEVLTSYQEETLLKFNCSPTYLPEASKWFDAFSLANNHMDNMQEFDGLNKTRQNLDKSDIQYFGHFDNINTSDICEVVSLPSRAIYNPSDLNKINQLKPEEVKEEAVPEATPKEGLKVEESQKETSENSTELSLTVSPAKESQKETENETTKTENSQENQDLKEESEEYVFSNPDDFVENYEIPVALCGYHNVFKLPTQEELNVISDFAEHFITIIMPHQGSEYGTSSDSLQKQYYRQMIDLGADFVIGNHPHSVHETESYNEKLIVYSLGNFIFDQQYNEIVTQGIGVNLDFEFEYDENIKKMQEIVKDCRGFQTDCLKIVQEKGIKKPNFKVNYDIIATDNSNQLAKKGDQRVQDLMLQRTLWIQVKPKLKTDFIFESKPKENLEEENKEIDKTEEKQDEKAVI